MNDFCTSVARVFAASFSRYALVTQMIAILVTAAMVFSGIDWYWYEATRSPHLLGVVIFAGLSGFLVPVFVPTGLLLFGSLESRALGRALLTSEIVAFLLAAIYKAGTGRLQPNLANGIDISHAFQFGILKHGIFWGWPSSHTIVAFAGAVTFALVMDRKWVRVPAIIYACAIGFGASIGFHWLSDVIAGALMGSAVAFVAHRESAKASFRPVSYESR
jgi:membrane-associated phospholipid phosphatase